MTRKEPSQSYGLSSENARYRSASSGVFTERLLPGGQRVKIMDNNVFNKAVNAASKVKRK